MEKVSVLFIWSSKAGSVAKHNLDRFYSFVEVPILGWAALASCSCEAAFSGDFGEFLKHRWDQVVFQCWFHETVHSDVWFHQSSSCIGVSFQNPGKRTYIDALSDVCCLMSNDKSGMVREVWSSVEHCGSAWMTFWEANCPKMPSDTLSVLSEYGTKIKTEKQVSIN